MHGMARASFARVGLRRGGAAAGAARLSMAAPRPAAEAAAALRSVAARAWWVAGRRAWAVPAVATIPLAMLCYAQPAVAQCDAGQSLLEAIRSGDRAAVVAAVRQLARQLDAEGFEAFAKAGGLQQLGAELEGANVGQKVDTLKALRALFKYGMVSHVEASNLVAGLIACIGACAIPCALRCATALGPVRGRSGSPVLVAPVINRAAPCLRAESALANSEPELCYEGIRLMEMLAQEPMLHRFLVKSGAQDPLTKVAGGASPQAKSFAARALAHLAVTSDAKASVIHRRLVDAGAYAALVNQVTDVNPGVSAHAAKAVGDVLGNGGEPAQKVIELGAVAALLALLDTIDGAEESPDGGAGAAAAASPTTVAGVGALAALGSRLADAIGMEGCQTLCNTATVLLSDASPVANLNATVAFTELARVQALEDVIAENREVRALRLCELLRCKDARVRTGSARCLANLALHPEYAQVLGRRDTVTAVLQSLAPHVEVATRTEASRAVSNLAANPLCRLILMREGALKASVAILRQAEGVESDLASYALKTVTLFAQNQFRKLPQSQLSIATTIS